MTDLARNSTYKFGQTASTRHIIDPAVVQTRFGNLLRLSGTIDAKKPNVFNVSDNQPPVTALTIGYSLRAMISNYDDDNVVELDLVDSKGSIVNGTVYESSVTDAPSSSHTDVPVGPRFTTNLDLEKQLSRLTIIQAIYQKTNESGTLGTYTGGNDWKWLEEDVRHFEIIHAVPPPKRKVYSKIKTDDQNVQKVIFGIDGSVGLKKLKLSLSELSDESSANLNTKEFIIDITETPTSAPTSSNSNLKHISDHEELEFGELNRNDWFGSFEFNSGFADVSSTPNNWANLNPEKKYALRVVAFNNYGSSLPTTAVFNDQDLRPKQCYNFSIENVLTDNILQEFKVLYSMNADEDNKDITPYLTFHDVNDSTAIATLEIDSPINLKKLLNQKLQDLQSAEISLDRATKNGYSVTTLTTNYNTALDNLRSAQLNDEKLFSFENNNVTLSLGLPYVLDNLKKANGAVLTGSSYNAKWGDLTTLLGNKPLIVKLTLKRYLKSGLSVDSRNNLLSPAPSAPLLLAIHGDIDADRNNYPTILQITEAAGVYDYKLTGNFKANTWNRGKYDTSLILKVNNSERLKYIKNSWNGIDSYFSSSTSVPQPTFNTIESLLASQCEIEFSAVPVVAGTVVPTIKNRLLTEELIKNYISERTIKKKYTLSEDNFRRVPRTPSFKSIEAFRRYVFTEVNSEMISFKDTQALNYKLQSKRPNQADTSYADVPNWILVDRSDDGFDRFQMIVPVTSVPLSVTDTASGDDLVYRVAVQAVSSSTDIPNGTTKYSTTFTRTEFEGVGTFTDFVMSPQISFLNSRNPSNEGDVPPELLVSIKRDEYSSPLIPNQNSYHILNKLIVWEVDQLGNKIKNPVTTLNNGEFEFVSEITNTVTDAPNLLNQYSTFKFTPPINMEQGKLRRYMVELQGGYEEYQNALHNRRTFTVYSNVIEFSTRKNPVIKNITMSNYLTETGVPKGRVMFDLEHGGYKLDDFSNFDGSNPIMCISVPSEEAIKRGQLSMITYATFTIVNNFVDRITINIDHEIVLGENGKLGPLLLLLTLKNGRSVVSSNGL